MTLATRIDPLPYELVIGATYTVSEDDLDIEYTLRRDDGVRLAYGWNKIGMRVTLPLDVTLCGYCDGEVTADGQCADCEVVHLPELAPENRGKWL